MELVDQIERLEHADGRLTRILVRQVEIDEPEAVEVVGIRRLDLV